MNDGADGEVDLMYLGIVGIKSRGSKIIRSAWVYGESHRAINRLLVFDEQDKLLGNYYVTSIEDLPDKIESRELVFLNSMNGDCDKTVISTISFEDGIPKEILFAAKITPRTSFHFPSSNDVVFDIWVHTIPCLLMQNVCVAIHTSPDFNLKPEKFGNIITVLILFHNPPAYPRWQRENTATVSRMNKGVNSFDRCYGLTGRDN